MNRRRFQKLVEAALGDIPPRLREGMKNLAIVIDDWPAAELMEEMYGDPDTYVYGLFSGTPLPERHLEDSGDLPAVIHIYQAALEADFPDPRDLREEIAITLVHEIAHFMGLDEEAIAGFGYA